MNDLKKIFLKKKILIYGLGKSGFSSYHFLKKNNYISLYDDNKKIFNINKRSFKKLLLKKKKINKSKFDYIVISPGINVNNCNLKKYLKKNLKRIITDLDIFYSHYSENKIITITGTNGKSTTANLLHKILKNHKKDSRLCGNIGNPILLEKNISKKTVFVIEASSYQIDYSNIFKTNYAIILNISPDHLERHNSIKNYVNAKFKLVKNQSKKDFAYINVKDKYLKKTIKRSKIFSRLIKINLKAINVFKKKIKNPYFLTKGNLENLSFIFSICQTLKLKNEKIFQIINKFKGLKFRQQIIYNKNKVTCINDSKATSFASSINILKSLQKVFWIVGGIPKLGDKFTLKKNECKNISAYIFGKRKIFFAKQFKNKLSFYYFKDLQSAVQKVLNDLKLNNNSLKKSILFSPSAASFDSFKDFEERGYYFNFLFKKYKAEKVINALK
jgi:UDP-N-acetylmuramoylalanine--D-glutamate ligase